MGGKLDDETSGGRFRPYLKLNPDGRLEKMPAKLRISERSDLPGARTPRQGQRFIAFVRALNSEYPTVSAA